MAESFEVKKNKKNENLIDVKMTITRGKMLSLLHALDLKANSSPIAEELVNMLRRKAQETQTEV